MSIPAGWYPDPHPDAPAGALRWWDGAAWTDQIDAGDTTSLPTQATETRPLPADSGPVDLEKAPKGSPAEGASTAHGASVADGVPAAGPQAQQQRQSASEPPYAGQGYPGQQPHPGQPGAGGPQYLSQQQYPGQYPAQLPAVPQMTHCPDGVSLASPWVRLGAYLLDMLIAFVVMLVAVLVLALVIGGAALVFSAGSDGSVDRGADAVGVVLMSLLSMVAFALSIGYYLWAFVWRVRTRGASPGKQMLGLKIRTFHADGQLTNGQVWGRVGLPYIAGSLTGGIATIVDYVWLLWDRHVQCLHDKAVGTVVVNLREPVAPPEHPGVQLARTFPASRGWVADGPVPPGTATTAYRA